MHLTFCGIKHAGKTSIGRAAALRLGLPFYDTDDVLQRLYFLKTGVTRPVREIYKVLGEDPFRQLEMEAIRTLADTDCVIALGGGALSNPYFTDGDRALLGFLCCLDVPDEVAFERVAREGLPPFLVKESDPFSAFCKSNKVRRDIFRKTADLLFMADPSSNPEENATKILSAVKDAGGDL